MRIESDILKTTLVIALLCGVYGGLVYWPSQQQNEALAQEIQSQQAAYAAMPLPELEPLRQQIDALRDEVREREMDLPVGDLHDRVLQHVSDTLISNGVTLYETSYRPSKTFKRFALRPIDIRFDTNFQHAFAILQGIENQGPPVRIERLELIGSPDETTGHVGVNVELSSFYLPAEAEQGGER